MMPTRETFEAADLATLQQQVDDYVDELLAEGCPAWSCYFMRNNLLDSSGRQAAGFICTVEHWT